MRSDHTQSVAFLRAWGKGPWVLSAIHPDQKKIETDTLGEPEVQDWLERHSDHNLYFQVNPPIRPLKKKADRTDILEVAWLHVDVDPRQGEDLTKEQERIQRLFGEDLPKGVPEPSCLLFSGGGYQAFWKLEEPLSIKGDLEAAEEAKLYNLQLEIIFGADPCHNIDRIMRLPGTVNWPNARKRERGRVPTLAKLVYLKEDRVYPISGFVKAPPSGDEDRPARGRHKINVNDNVRRLGSVDDLPPNVSHKCRVVIVQGKDPDDPSRWQSRSEALFWVCCELVRADCDDDLIYSVITDPGFAISESVLEKGSRTKGYALHQIERARDDAVHPVLRELNDKCAVITNIGGKCRILYEGWDPVLDRREITFQSFQDFQNAHSNRSVDWNQNGKVQSMPLGKFWSGHPLRRQYEKVVFAPGFEVPKCYNLWSGFRFDPKPGDCDLFLGHVLGNICSGDQENYEYLLNWMARAVQHPAQPGHVAVVLRGGRGTGKSVFANTFGKLFGNHYLHVSNAKHVTGSFNAHLQDCLVLYADEAFAADDKRAEGVLKTLITEEMLTVEPKGVDAHMSRNFLHIIMASNETWVVPAGVDERRYFVLDVGEGKKQDTRYFRAIAKQMTTGGYGALLHLLLTRDLRGFEVRSAPKTAGLEKQKMLSLSSKEDWWLDKLTSGQIVEGRGWPDYVYVSELVHDYAMHLRLFTRRNGEAASATSLGIFLQGLDSRFVRKQLAGQHNVVQTDGTIRTVNRPSIYLIPTLEECRAKWEEKVGGRVDWPGESNLKTQQEKEVF